MRLFPYTFCTDPSPSELDEDGLVENPMYHTQLPRERGGYMALLKQQVAEDEDSLYSNIVRRQ